MAHSTRIPGKMESICPKKLLANKIVFQRVIIDNTTPPASTRFAESAPSVPSIENRPTKAGNYKSGELTTALVDLLHKNQNLLGCDVLSHEQRQSVPHGLMELVVAHLAIEEAGNCCLQLVHSLHCVFLSIDRSSIKFIQAIIILALKILE